MLDDVDVSEQLNAAEARRNAEIRRHQLLREVDFGLQVQQFLDGPIGQRVLADSERELKDIANEMFTLNVDNDRDRLRALMFRAGVLQHWQDCFGAYIIAGRNAEKEVSEEFD